jgi:adenosylmethionine-8-amino-7-oxononanoate aminotransferase
VHGHTYQGHPIACAAALEIQKIIREQKLLTNVQELGKLLEQRLHERLDHHPNVGNIRGRGLFWGIELVSDKNTGEPFPAAAGIAMGLAELGLAERYGIALYPGSGTADGINGDHIMVSPPYNTTAEEIEVIVERLQRLVCDYFEARSKL